MNKKDFTDEVAKRCMVTPYLVDEIYNVSSGLTIEGLLKGEKVEIPYMGIFEIKEKPTIKYDNLFGKGERVVDGFKYPSFQPTKNLKNRVKNGSKYPKIT